MEVIKFEEAHTEWLRNCKAYENICHPDFNTRIAYAVCRIDDEYGWKVLSGVFFTADEAFRYACEVANSNSWSGDYSDFLLIEDTDAWFLLDKDLRISWSYTEYAIFEYCGGQPPLRMSLYGKDSVVA